MKCPKCQEEMDEGMFRTRVSVLGLPAFGYSGDLYFKEVGHSVVEVKVMRGRDRVKGFRCDSCAVSIVVEYY